MYLEVCKSTALCVGYSLNCVAKAIGHKDYFEAEGQTNYIDDRAISPCVMLSYGILEEVVGFT